MLDAPSQLTAATRPRSERGPLFIISGRCGRLANRIVLFANFVAFAAEHDARVMNPTFHSFATLFEATRRDVFCQYPPAARRSIIDQIPGLASAIRGTRLFFHVARVNSVLNERFPLYGRRVVTLRETSRRTTTDLSGPDVAAKIRDARIVLVNGWTFRSHGLTLRHGEAIRRYFRPVPSLQDASRLAVDRLRENADIVVGVHVRRGDYATWRNGRFFFGLSQYAAWMRQLTEQFPAQRVAFFVCSNEPLAKGDLSGLPLGFGQGHPVSDLYGLAECDYVFGPPSTYSQWASFYGNKPLLHLYEAAEPANLEHFAVSDLCDIPGWRPA